MNLWPLNTRLRELIMTDTDKKAKLTRFTGRDARLLRLILGLSVHELADLANYNASTVRSMESSFYATSDRLVFALAAAVKEPAVMENLQHMKRCIAIVEKLGGDVCLTQEPHE